VQFATPIKNRKSVMYPRACRRLHPDDQRLSLHLEVLDRPSHRVKRNLDLNVGLRRKLRIRIDKHPFWTDVPRKTSSPVRNTLFVPPLEIHIDAEAITGLFSLFQAFA
jgi:hypothetical protein